VAITLVGRSEPADQRVEINSTWRAPELAAA
jgi:hypothetical protein